MATNKDMDLHKDQNDPPEHPVMEQLRQLRREAEAERSRQNAQDRALLGLPPIVRPGQLSQGPHIPTDNRISKPGTRSNAATGRSVSAKNRRERLTVALDASLATETQTSHSGASANSFAGRSASAASNGEQATARVAHTSQRAAAVAGGKSTVRAGSSSARMSSEKSRNSGHNRQGVHLSAASTQESGDVSNTANPSSELEHGHRGITSTPPDGISRANLVEMSSHLSRSLAETVSQSMKSTVGDIVARADEQSAKIGEQSAKIAEIEAENHEQRSRAQNAQQENETRFRQTENAVQVQSQQLHNSHAMMLHLDERVSDGTRYIRALHDQAQDSARHFGELGRISQVHGQEINSIQQDNALIQRDNALNSNRVVMVASEVLQHRADIHAIVQQVAGMQARIESLRSLGASDQMPSLEAPPGQSSAYSAPLPQIEYHQTDPVRKTRQLLEAPSGLAGQHVPPWSSDAACQDDMDVVEHPLAPCRRAIVKEQQSWVEKRQNLSTTYSNGVDELQARIGTVIAPYDGARSELRDHAKFDSARKTLADFALNAHRYFEYVLTEAETRISEIWKECDEAIQYTLRDGQVNEEQMRAEFEDHRSRASRLVADEIPREFGVILENFKTTYLEFFRQWPKPASKSHQSEFLQQWRPAHDQLIKMLSLDEPRHAEHHRLPTTDEAFHVATAVQPLAITAPTGV
ncbi:hypothetical protein PV04_07145 [Phialophora macrospora]|uniref:Uncharacterized protein n=1 Tax=Phialophora macrospora TaxID=1851006 RepID=A0A0D2FY56_9EURO|nr:hypothetical protein PV04_07145 [Phialophora macrospora]